MDLNLKKRKADENGSAISDFSLPLEDLQKIIEPFTKEQLLDIVKNAAYNHIDVLNAIRSIANHDPAQRKLFVRGLGWETTTEGLKALFSAYGEIEEGVVILDKVTGKSKGYGFVTFKHIDGAMLALKEPSKKIDGRVTVTQLAAAGITPGPVANTPSAADAALRKIFVGNVPYDMPPEKLLAHMALYGEIEEGPLGYDKTTGKSKGFALFVYKTLEGARAAISEPNKIVEGHQLVCKVAENKKAKPVTPASVGAGGAAAATVPTPTSAQTEVSGGPGALQAPPQQSSMPGSFTSSYGVPGGAPMGVGGPGGPVGVGAHSGTMGVGAGAGAGAGMPGGPMGVGAPGGGFSGYGPYGAGGHMGPAGMGHQPHPHLGSSFPSSIGAGVGAGSGLPALGTSGGYGAGLPYSGLGVGPTSGAYGGPGSVGYAGLGVGAGGPGSAGYAGLGVGAGAGAGLGVGASSLYRLPPSSMGMPSGGGYGESAHYSLSSSSQHPSSTSSPATKGSLYPNLPSYY